jgi:hypothetical protein
MLTVMIALQGHSTLTLIGVSALAVSEDAVPCGRNIRGWAMARFAIYRIVYFAEGIHLTDR